MSQGPWSHHSRSASVADDIDFEIKGQELQFVEIELDPGESAVAEAGSFVWKDASIEMTTVFGDGSGAQTGGFMGALLGAGKRLVTGESLFTTVFTHQGAGKATPKSEILNTYWQVERPGQPHPHGAAHQRHSGAAKQVLHQRDNDVSFPRGQQ